MALQNFGIKPIKDFLANTYRIPDYQREYSWEREELEELWDDLIYLESNNEENHFFGQIVINSTNKEKYIIDGQQRTTTSLIILCAIMREFEKIYAEHGEKFIKAFKKSQAIQIKMIGTDDEEDLLEKFHLTLGEIDNAYFKQSILEKEDFSIPEKYKSHTRLKEAYLFFKEKIASYISVTDIEAKYNNLISLYEKFTSNFIVMYIERMSGIHLAIQVFSKGYRPKQGKVAP